MGPYPVSIFYYNPDSFFNISSLESMYRSENDRDATGATNMDDYSLVADDAKFYEKLLKRAVGACHDLLQAFTAGIPYAIGYKDNPRRTVDQLNDMVSPVEGLVFKCIDSGILIPGNLSVVAGDKVIYTGGVWTKNNGASTVYIYFMLGLPNSYDHNNDFNLDNKIEEFIIAYTMLEWFKRKRYSLDIVVPELESIKTDISRLINSRVQIKKIYRTY